MSLESSLYRLVWAVAAFLLGALTSQAFAPTGWWWLPPFSLAPLLWLCLAGNAGPLTAFRLAWWWGFGLFFVGIGWIQVSLTIYGELPWLLGWAAVALLAGFLALFPASALWLAATLVRRQLPRLLLAAPAAWVLSEWLRGWIFTGFPWLSLGDSQAPDGWLAPLAPVLGHFGISGLLVLAAALLALALQPAPQRQAWRLLGALAGLLTLGLLAAAAGRFEWSRPLGEPVRVALLQPDTEQSTKWSPGRAASIAESLAEQIELASDGADWVIAPETAIPVFLEDMPPGMLEGLRQPVLGRGAELLVGLPTGVRHGYYNSVVSLGSTANMPYHKHHLVPFGEFVPYGFRWFVDAVAIPMADFSRGGADQPPMALGDQRLALMICYEDIFASEVARRAVSSTLLVNLTNDAWFGETAASWQHAQQSQMRALENARPLLRATNNGVTLLADHRGRVIDALPRFSAGTLLVTVQGRSGDTPYQWWGDTLAVGLALLALLAAALISPPNRDAKQFPHLGR